MMKNMSMSKKLLTISIGMLLIATLFSTMAVAQEEMIATADPLSEGYTGSVKPVIDPSLSFVTLTDDNLDGLTTCPKGDGPTYNYLKITVQDQNGNPIAGISEKAFNFMVSPEPGTIALSQPYCSFNAYGPTSNSDSIIVVTNGNGEILFRVIGLTTIVGPMKIQVKIKDVTLNDADLLSCKSFDLNHDGVVDCPDFEIFASDYRHESGEIERSDFDWDDDVDLADFAMFAAHLEGPCELNQAPLPPYQPDPTNTSISVSVNTDFSWNCKDPNKIDILTYTMSLGTSPDALYTFIVGSYPATESRITYEHGVPLLHHTTYYWKIKVTDNRGASSESPLWTFTTEHDIEAPSAVPGFHVDQEKDSELDLVWEAASDNASIAYYNLSRDGVFIISTNNLYYNDRGLTNGQLYTYSIYAVDPAGNAGPLSYTSGTPRAAAHYGGHNSDGNSGSESISENSPPVADLSAGESYVGFVKEEVIFDGSNSHDSDGSIVSYAWTFGDGTSGSGVIANHAFQQSGSYIVTLIVTDDDGATDEATSTVLIKEPNRVPLLPTLKGPQHGHYLIDYQYAFNADDPDNDAVRYLINWGDGSSSISPYFKDERVIMTSHHWNTLGFYTITLIAEDENHGQSQPVTLDVWIDVWKVNDIGYLMNINAAGPFDIFHTNNHGNTDIEVLQNNTLYFIDTDADGVYNYTYNIATNELLPYNPLREIDYLILILFVLIILILFLLFGALLRRTKNRTWKSK